MAKPCLVYGRPDCEDTQRALELLDHRGVTYDFFNINEDPEAERFVVQYNSGMRITPTIIMGLEENRRVLVEPSDEELSDTLDEMGYESPQQRR